MTATAQSWATMTYNQQTFWIYFYTFVPLAALMGLWYLLAYHFTDYEPALQFALLVAWFRERRWRDHLPARSPKNRTAARRGIPPHRARVAAAAAVCPDTADWPGVPRPPRGTPGTPSPRPASRPPRDGVSVPGARPLENPTDRGRAHALRNGAR